MEKLLDKINSPEDLKKIPVEDLPRLAEEVRERIVDVTAKNGGHIAASLGAVDITLALHYILESPKDKIVWDVGHQSYAHKIITGRNAHFDTIRKLGGLSGFPNREESEHDTFTVGHSSTSISQALGLACARDVLKSDEKIVCVIGDAAIAGGLSLEALNSAGQLNKDILVVLNDNEQSISKTVGALSLYLNRIMTNPTYNKVREDMQRLVKRIPFFGFRAFRAARRLEEGLKGMLIPGMWFEELGLRYFGPIDGHDIGQLIITLKNVLKLKGPKIVHVITKKGKGYKFAEAKPCDFHGPSPFNVDTGEPLEVESGVKPQETYSDIFGSKIASMAEKDGSIVAVTAAMRDGTGLTQFAKKFPERFFDVGIAEEHAVTFCGALARGGLKPVLAVYSTFLQRGYDQIIHDVCLQKLPVVFCIDRAGIVGRDGPTHHGVFDLAFLKHIPNLVIMSPRDGMELESMMESAFALKSPVAIRYPRASLSSHIPGATFHKIETGRSEMLRAGKDLAIIALGSMAQNAVKIADILSGKNIEAYVVNARFAKPIDGDMLIDMALRTRRIVTLEEGVTVGGFGSACLEHLTRAGVKNIDFKMIGLPDQFIEHGKREELFIKYHMTSDQIAENIMAEMFKR